MGILDVPPTLATCKVIVSNTVTRPADTTAYSTGDLIANSTTAGSVTPFSFTNAVRVAGNTSRIDRIRIKKSGTSITSATFRVHFYAATPAVTNGDNGTWLTTVTDYIGAFDVVVDRAFSNGAEGAGLPIVGGGIQFILNAGTTLYGLIEARAGYVPVSGETFTLIAELTQF